jgi:CheY-like chemotaxis protein
MLNVEGLSCIAENTQMSFCLMMDGIEVLKQIRTVDSTERVIVLTGGQECSDGAPDACAWSERVPRKRLLVASPGGHRKALFRRACGCSLAMS